MQVTVTGGAGFIGRHLVAALAARGHRAVVLDNLHRGDFDWPGAAMATCIAGDVRNPDDCARAVSGSDAVVHLAAQSNVMGSQSNPNYTYETNVNGTWNVARAASDAGVRHLVFASSREAYGEPTSLPVCEAAPLNPHNLYGASKAAGELLLRTLPASLAVSVLRLGNVIGPGDSGRVVPLWLAAANESRPMVLYGGAQVLDFVPVDLVCEAFIRVLEGEPLTAPVNVACGKGTTLQELAARIQTLAGGSVPLDVQPAREAEVTRFVADVSRMRTVLGIEPPGDPLAILSGMVVARS